MLAVVVLSMNTIDIELISWHILFKGPTAWIKLAAIPFPNSEASLIS